MQSILSTLGQAFRKSVVILSLVTLLGLSNLFIFTSQPAYAAKLNPQAAIQQDVGSRVEAYEEAVEEAQNPAKMDEAYEEELEEYKESQPDTGLIEGAKDLVEKVTGK